MLEAETVKSLIDSVEKKKLYKIDPIFFNLKEGPRKITPLPANRQIGPMHKIKHWSRLPKTLWLRGRPIQNMDGRKLRQP